MQNALGESSTPVGGDRTVRMLAPTENERNSNHPMVGIVVTAYNNSETIEETILSLSLQSYNPKHIYVVVDSSSRDNTERVVDSCCSRLSGCTIIRCRGVGRSNARNVGWGEAQTPIVMFADGDDIYEREYLDKAVNAIANQPLVGGVCVGGAALPTGTKTLDDYYLAYGTTDDRMNTGEQPGWAWVYKLECLKVTNGFDESLSQAEDREFCSRVKLAGYSIAYVAGVNWYRRKASTFLEFVRKELHAGKRRVFFEVKDRSYGSIVRGLAPALVLLVVPLSDTLGLVQGALIGAGLVATYLVASALRAKRKIRTVASFCRFALMLVSARFAFFAGTLEGLAILLARSLGLATPDTGRS